MLPEKTDQKEGKQEYFDDSKNYLVSDGPAISSNSSGVRVHRIRLK